MIRTAALLFWLASVVLAQSALPPLPPTPKRPAREVLHGVTIVDDYQWLENGASPEVRAWSQEENRHGRAYLDDIPARKPIADWLKRVLLARSADYSDLDYRGGLIFAIKTDPQREQPVLVTLRSADNPTGERVVVDPNAIDSKGTTAIQFYVPSLDGKLVAVCLAEGGSENGGVRVFDVASGRELPDAVPRVQYATAGGSVSWNADGSGFYYTRYPQGNERPPADLNFYQQVYFHKLGTPASQDAYAIGKEFPRIAETTLLTSDDGRFVLAIVANGDGGQYEHFLRLPGGRWEQITHFDDKVSAVTFGPDNALYLLSRDHAPNGKILRLPPAAAPGSPAPALRDAKVVVPESSAAIEAFRFTFSGEFSAFVATAGRLYVVDTVGGPQQVRVFDHDGKQLPKIPLDPVSAVEQLLDIGGDAILVRSQTFLSPPAWDRYDAPAGKVEPTALRHVSPVDFSDAEAVRESATSKDGTQVPLTVIRRKGTKLDGQNPTLLTGYGGFGLSINPHFDSSVRLWLDHGGVVAVANLRGGGEFGERWHQAGMLTNKQHVFDDFLACAQHLIAVHYTSPAKLAIEGGSNGGLLVGAALTQRPDLFRAVIAQVGIYDMLILENSSNGQFNTTEYGSIRNPEQFRAMLAYSPYEHVVNRTAYPAALFMTGENDARVDPAQSRKMVARLQAVDHGKGPVLLRTSASAGHGGIGAAESERIAWAADSWAFLFDQLGMKW